MGAVRVFVVEDHEIVIDGLRWMLEGDTGLEIVGHAQSAAQATEMLATFTPDVLLLDLHLSDRSGPGVVAHFAQEFPALPIVVFTAHDEPEYVEEAVGAGAAGYLLKTAPRDEMVRAIQAAASGDAYIQAEVTKPLLAKFARESRTDGELAALSPRELEVVALLAEGLADKQIAIQLGLSESTVKGYLRNLYEKLGASDRAQAVSIAIRSRLID